MRLAGCADRAFDRAVVSEDDPAVGLQLSAAAARLGDRFRRGLLTLQRLNGGGPGKPRKIAGTVWGGPEPSLHVAGSTPANDSPAAPAAPPRPRSPLGMGSTARIRGAPVGRPLHPAAPRPESPLGKGSIA